VRVPAPSHTCLRMLRPSWVRFTARTVARSGPAHGDQHVRGSHPSTCVTRQHTRVQCTGACTRPAEVLSQHSSARDGWSYCATRRSYLCGGHRRGQVQRAFRRRRLVCWLLHQHCSEVCATPATGRLSHTRTHRPGTPRCPSVVLWTPCSGVGWRVVRTGHQRAAPRASSLRTWRWRLRRSLCPPCPTTNPPCVPRPSAVDHLARDMLQRLTCSRTATVVSVVPDVR
jgi:hypothetical protein